MLNFEDIFAKIESERSRDVNDRVLIVDSLNTFIRVWTTMPEISESGDHVGGIIGMLRSIGKDIREFNPSRCVLVFDGKGGSLRRKKIFPEYKSGRTNTNVLRRDFFSNPEDEQIDMRKQMRRVIEYFSHLPVQILCVDNIEADDAIAHCTMQYFNDKSKKIRIVSTDRDFLQLVSDQVEVWSPIKKKLYTPDVLRHEFQIHHNNYLLYRAITGDKSDNIPGIEGIGLKTLLKEFPELLEVELNIDSLSEISKSKLVEKKVKKVHQNICENLDILERNYKLMQLQDTDISLDSKLRILSTLEQPINKMDRLILRRFIAEDYLQSSFKNFDSWLDSTFNGLSVWTK